MMSAQPSSGCDVPSSWLNFRLTSTFSGLQGNARKELNEILLAQSIPQLYCGLKRPALLAPKLLS